MSSSEATPRRSSSLSWRHFMVVAGPGLTQLVGAHARHRRVGLWPAAVAIHIDAGPVHRAGADRAARHRDAPRPRRVDPRPVRACLGLALGMAAFGQNNQGRNLVFLLPGQTSAGSILAVYDSVSNNLGLIYDNPGPQSGYRVVPKPDGPEASWLPPAGPTSGVATDMVHAELPTTLVASTR